MAEEIRGKVIIELPQFLNGFKRGLNRCHVRPAKSQVENEHENEVKQLSVHRKINKQRSVKLI